MGPQIAFHPGESVFPHIAAKYQPIETGQCSTQLLFILRDKIVHGVSLAFGVLFWNNKHPTSGETPLLSLVAAMLLCGAGGFACRSHGREHLSPYCATIARMPIPAEKADSRLMR